MSLDLFALALKITSEGEASAKRALEAVDAGGRKAGATTDALTAKLKLEDQQLRRMVETEGLRTAVANRAAEARLKEIGMLERYRQIQQQVRQEMIASDAIAAKLATTTNIGSGALAAGSISASRFRSSLSTLASQAVGTSSSVGQLGGLLGSLALGSGVSVAILGGIAAIAFAYDKITKSAREARKASNDMIDDLVRQGKARELGTAGGQQKRLEALAKEFAAAQAALAKAQQGRAFGSVISGNPIMVDPAQVAAAEANIARIMAAIKEASLTLGETMQQEAPKVERATKAIKDRAEALGELSKIQGPHIGITPQGFTPSILAGDMSGVPESAIPDLRKGAAGARAALDEVSIEIMKAAQAAAERMQLQVAQIFGDALVNGLTAAFRGDGILGAFKELTATLLQGFGSMMIQLGEQAIMASAFVQGIVAALASLNPFVLLAAGVALVALGAAIGGVGGGGSGRGFNSAAIGMPGRGTEELTRFKFIDRNGNQAVTPLQPIHFTVIGANDPVAQRQITELVTKASRRAA